MSFTFYQHAHIDIAFYRDSPTGTKIPTCKLFDEYLSRSVSDTSFLWIEGVRYRLPSCDVSARTAGDESHTLLNPFEDILFLGRRQVIMLHYIQNMRNIV
jgi:hypothetical protein